MVLSRKEQILLLRIVFNGNKKRIPAGILQKELIGISPIKGSRFFLALKELKKHGLIDVVSISWLKRKLVEFFNVGSDKNKSWMKADNRDKVVCPTSLGKDFAQMIKDVERTNIP